MMMKLTEIEIEIVRKSLRGRARLADRVKEIEAGLGDFVEFDMKPFIQGGLVLLGDSGEGLSVIKDSHRENLDAQYDELLKDWADKEGDSESERKINQGEREALVEGLAVSKAWRDQGRVPLYLRYTLLKDHVLSVVEDNMHDLIMAEGSVGTRRGRGSVFDQFERVILDWSRAYEGGKDHVLAGAPLHELKGY